LALVNTELASYCASGDSSSDLGGRVDGIANGAAVELNSRG